MNFDRVLVCDVWLSQLLASQLASQLLISLQLHQPVTAPLPHSVSALTPSSFSEHPTRRKNNNNSMAHPRLHPWYFSVSTRHLLRLQRALIVRLVLRVNWWQVLEEVEVSSVARDDSERLM